MKFPRSGFDQVGGICYLPRMLDKIRLHRSGELPADYHANLGQGMDGRCCRYLHVQYEALVTQVHKGGSDDEVLQWIQSAGRKLNEVEIMVWNGFTTKRGWNDEASQVLEEQKQSGGLGHRTDIRTFFEYFEVDEKRKT